MKKTVNTLKLKEAEITKTTENKGIGNDLILVNDYHCPFAEGELFRSDAATAILYEQGSNDISIDMKRYHIEAPAILLFLDNMIIEYGRHSDDLKSKVIVMSNHFTQSLFQSSDISRELFVSIRDNPLFLLKKGEMEIFNHYYEMLENIVDYRDNPYRLETAKHLTLAMFFGYAYQNHRIKERKSLLRQDELLDKFMELLKLNHKRQRDLQFYADKMFISIKHLSNTVKAATGKTASKWIEDYVIIESKALLRSTEMSISQIADEMGFGDQSLFGKYFKRVTGMSPKEYRSR